MVERLESLKVRRLFTRISRYLLISAIYICTLSCIDNSSNKLSCYNDYLTSLKKEEVYSTILASVHKSIPTLKTPQNRVILQDTSFIINWKLDDAIFFNSKKDKCLLLILEQTNKDLRLDQIEIVQGTLVDKSWRFSLDRLPEIPHTIYTIGKEVKKDGNQNNTFNTLAKKGRLFILTAGTVDFFGCSIDNNYWFNE